MTNINNNGGDPIIVRATAIEVVQEDESAHGSSSSSNGNNNNNSNNNHGTLPEVTVGLTGNNNNSRGGGGDVHQLALDLEQVQNHVLGLKSQLRQLQQKVSSYEQAVFTVFTLVLGLLLGSVVQFVYQQQVQLVLLNSSLSSNNNNNNLAASIGALIQQAYMTEPFSSYSSLSPPARKQGGKTKPGRQPRTTQHVEQFATGTDSRYTGPMIKYELLSNDIWKPHGGFGVQEFPQARQEGVWHHGKLHGYARVVTWVEVVSTPTTRKNATTNATTSTVDNTSSKAIDNNNNNNNNKSNSTTTTTTTLAATIYQGQFQNHQLHGHGSVTYPDGSHFEGHFLRYQRHGYGTLYNATEQTWVQGWWRDNRLVQVMAHEEEELNVADEQSNVAGREQQDVLEKDGDEL